ncbi:MAG: biopolymer transporter ExbD [Planctomycetaceae bacterium]|nr:biopolymer transporter ExbD [Planctomycetaceae bacterium]
MKIRNQQASAKIETQMAPMIDVVFQLLIFFMLTLKIIEPEGDFDINMPVGAPSESASTDENIPPIKVRLHANRETGELTDLTINGQSLGADALAFERLNVEIMREAERDKAALTPEQRDRREVEIDPDHGLHYEYIVHALGASSGRIVDGKMVRYYSHVKFAPIREP